MLSCVRPLCLMLMVCVLLASCASPTGLKPSRAVQEGGWDTIRNVEIASILSNSFHSIYLGVTRFSNTYHQSDAGDWAINDFLTGLIKEAILQDRRFNYVDTGINKEELRRGYTRKKSGEQNFNIRRIDSQLEDLYRLHGVDTLVLIIENQIEDPIQDTIQDFVGYGLYRNALSFKSVYLYSYLKVLVIDTRSKKIRKEIVATDHLKLPKEFWAEQLGSLVSKKKRHLRNESLRIAGSNVLGALVESGLIAEEVAHTTESGAVRLTDRLQEASNYGQLYEDAVDRVYRSLEIEKHFERYALLMQGRHEEVIDDADSYRDIYLHWMRKHVSWEILKPKIIDEYRKMFTADELNEIADFAESEVGAKMLKQIPMILREQENIWLKEAKDKVDLLDDAVMNRREATVY